MTIKGKRVRYLKIVSLLSILQGTFNMNENSSGKFEMQVLLCKLQIQNLSLAQAYNLDLH